MTLTDASPTPHRTGFDTVLELPFPFFVRAAQAMLAGLGKTPSKDLPYLDVARFDGDQLMSTDRYKAALVAVPEHAAASHDRHVRGEAFSIPRSALTYISKLKLTPLQRKTSLPTMTAGGFTIRVVAVPDLGVTVDVLDTHGEQISGEEFAPAAPGNYPPVGNLLARWEPAGDDRVEVLDGLHLSAIAAYAAGNPDGNRLMSIDFGKPKKHTWGSETPGAARIKTADAVFLINPAKPL